MWPERSVRDGATRRFWARNGTCCLYHRNLRTRDELRGATWTHQPGPVRRMTKDPDHPIVKIHRVSAATRTKLLAVRPGDIRKTRAASAVTSSVTRVGEMGWSACTAPAPSNFSPKSFLSHHTPAPPPFRRPLWRGTRRASYSAPSVTMDRTSGPMGSSLTRDPLCPPLREKFHSDPGTLDSCRHSWDAWTKTLTVRGGKGEPDRQSGG